MHNIDFTHYDAHHTLDAPKSVLIAIIISSRLPRHFPSHFFFQFLSQGIGPARVLSMLRLVFHSRLWLYAQDTTPTHVNNLATIYSSFDSTLSLRSNFILAFQCVTIGPCTAFLSASH
jgi:hypothetical protein